MFHIDSSICAEQKLFFFSFLQSLKAWKQHFLKQILAKCSCLGIHRESQLLLFERLYNETRYKSILNIIYKCTGSLVLNRVEVFTQSAVYIDFGIPYVGSPLCQTMFAQLFAFQTRDMTWIRNIPYSLLWRRYVNMWRWSHSGVWIID